jgi:HJR/Mrr/RecB family endonuclease
VADLTDANLSEAVLKSADLTGSNLERSSLRKAIIGDTLLDIPPHWRWSKGPTLDLNRHYGVALLNSSNLRHADLFGAKLICVLLEGANLVSANLSHADLRRSYLAGCRFDHAVLEDADLREASFSTAFGRSAVFAGTKLRGARLTTESEGAPHGGFLELAACNGLDTAEFDSEEFLGHYLARAWHYLHQSDIAERRHYPDFLTATTDRIRALRFLYADDEPPAVVIETITSVNLEMLAYLRKHQDAIYRMGPLVFEQLVAELLAHFGWQVSLTRSTKDGGFDIFAISGNQAGVNTSWLIECKRFGPDRPVGVSLVRALYGTTVRLGVAGAMLATTSSFTKGAKEFAGSTYDLSLKDYNDILDWVNAYRPNPDGRLYIRDRSLIVPTKPAKRHGRLRDNRR